MASKTSTKRTFLGEITIAEAMERLTAMTSLDSSSKKEWLSLDSIRQTFSVLYQHLKDIYKKDKEKIKEEETLQGVRAMMVLVGEAVENIDKYSQLIEKGVFEKSVTELREYQDLQEFYQKKIKKKLQKASDTKELWKEEWEESLEEGSDINTEARGIKDLSAVKDDYQYELLYLKKEDGRRFFNRNLLRHIKLVNDFDRVIVSECHDDPFLLIQKVQDASALDAAKEMKGAVRAHLANFLRVYQHMHSSEFYNKVSYAVYALILATSHHNLLESGGRKTCFQYLKDFSMYLKEAFLSTDYHAHSEELPEDLDIFIKELMFFAYELCEQFFVHVGSRDQMMGLINRLMDKVGAGEKKKPRLSTQLWTALLDGYDHLQNVLKKYPNGPLFKTLDTFATTDPYENFEPLVQENLPARLYYIQNEVLKVSVLRIPSPTKQEVINKAEVSVLFESFMRSLKILQKGQKLLFVNLQDRTSWQEHARCHVIEEMPKHSHFVDVLEVCSLAKDTSFYKQSEDYVEIKKAEDFMELFSQQVLSGEECGFYFPKSLSEPHLRGFTQESIRLIHLHFFGAKTSLSHKNRLDFIEIFYFFFTLKILDVIKPSHVTLSCKDSVDTGAAFYAGFFGFIKLLSQDDQWSMEEEDFFVWMMQSQALLQRERAIHIERYQRAVHALAVINAELDVDKRKIIAAFEKLYGYAIFKHITVSEAKPSC